MSDDDGMDGYTRRFSKLDASQFRPLVVRSAAACRRRDEDVSQLDLLGGAPASEGGGRPANKKVKASPQLDMF